MCPIPNTSGFNSSSSPSGEDRDFTNAFTGKDEYQEIIKKAEGYSLLKVFKKYKVNIDNFNRKSVCPFPSHKGGKESTASFWFYPETNSFWCFGCKTGRTAVDFISAYEKINKFQAAIKILKNLSGDSSELISVKDYQDSYQEKSKLFFSFSKKMREMISQSPASLEEIEKVYAVFDKMNSKYELEPKAIQLLVDRLTIQLEKIG